MAVKDTAVIDAPEVVEAEVVETIPADGARQNGAEKKPAEGVKYHTIEHDGVTLQVRKPQPKALAAFSLATSKHVPQEVRNDMTGYFVFSHFSRESYELVFYRLMDPDDTLYTAETVGEIMRRIVELASDNTGG